MRSETLHELIAVVRSTQPFEDADRALVDALYRIVERPDPANLLAALTVARGHWQRRDLLDTFGRTHLRELMQVLLPGLVVRKLDVRTYRPFRYEPNWQGDLFVQPNDELAQVHVSVGSLRGAKALEAMTRPARARIESVTAHAIDGESEPAIEAVLSALQFDGVTRLGIEDPARAVGMVLRCPSLASFSGPLTVEIAEALLTSAVSEVSTSSIEDGALAVLARAPFLNKLTLGGTGSLAVLAEFPALTELGLFGAQLDDADVVTISRIAGLERLMLPNHQISNAAPLARLTELRALDLHSTGVGDATLVALATLRNLLELDVLGTPITAAGIAAFAGKRLKIGLAWHEDALIAAARAAGLEVATDSEEGFSAGGAIWSVPVAQN